MVTEDPDIREGTRYYLATMKSMLKEWSPMVGHLIQMKDQTATSTFKFLMCEQAWDSGT